MKVRDGSHLIRCNHTQALDFKRFCSDVNRIVRVDDDGDIGACLLQDVFECTEQDTVLLCSYTPFLLGALDW